MKYRVKNKGVKFIFRYWIVGCIRLENKNVIFTEINKASWKNPQDYKDEVIDCSAEVSYTRSSSYKPRMPDFNDVEVVRGDFWGPRPGHGTLLL